MSKTVSSVAKTCLVAVVLALSIQSVVGYDVRYVYRSTGTGMVDLQAPGLCTTSDEASHTFMPTKEAFNTLATQRLTENGAALAPIGGFSRMSICVSTHCMWQYYKGLFNANEKTYFYGVYMDGSGVSDTDRTELVPGYYVGWRPKYPRYWENISYWGNRQPVLHSDGTWTNELVVTMFKNWVCEYYEYTQSDATILDFPTWINGDPIVPRAAGQSYFSHCGHKIYFDSQNRLADKQCHTKFPWWAGLIIAVCALVVLVSIIIIVWCCCCCCERRKEEEAREKKLQTTTDNQGSIPNQTEIGMSRHSSSIFTEDEDERSFSRSASDV